MVDKFCSTIDKFDRDREYWNEYYKERAKDALVPSDFAKHIAEILKPDSQVLELGCGNGRDSLFFLRQGFRVTAVDASDFAIGLLKEEVADRARFVCGDFVECGEIYGDKYDCIYSRFTLHAITKEQEDRLLGNVFRALRSGGFFCIEARTVHDDIYGLGEEVGYNEFIYNDHFRRFIEAEEFREKLESIGFSVVSLEENTGFSKTAESDPMLMRCVAKVEN